MPDASDRRVLYASPYVPPEWIAAHGLQPCVPTVHAGGVLTAGVCAWAAGYVSAVQHDTAVAGAIFTSTCDQMRRIFERITGDLGARAFLMHVPTTWETMQAQRYYRHELRRLGCFLVSVGGRPPTSGRLLETTIEYAARRAALREQAARLSPRAYSEAIARFFREGVVEAAGSGPAPRRGVPLALVGGPMMDDHWALFDLVEAAGGHVALDATTWGERALPPPVDRRAAREDPFECMADAHFGGIVDAFQRPNYRLYQWVKGETRARNVRGIIVRHFVWCDTWRAEIQRMHEWDGVPVLPLDCDSTPLEPARTLNRLQAFVESLS